MNDPVVWLVIAGAVVAVCILAVVSGRSVEVGKNGLRVAGAKGQKDLPHSKCAHRADVVMAYARRDEYLKQIHQIESKKLPKEIMQHCEDTLGRLMVAMESNFLRLLKTKGIATKAQVASTAQFTEYRVILERISALILDEFRRMMSENGFIMKELNGTWDGYVQQKVNDIINLTTKLLNDYYFIENPSRTELYDSNQTLIALRGSDDPLHTLEAAIRQLLEISKNWYREINKIQEKMDLDMAALWGSSEPKEG